MRSLIFIFFFFHFSLLFSQNSESKKLVDNKLTRSEVINLLDVGWELLYEDSDSMYIYDRMAMDLCEQFELVDLKAKVHANLGVYFDAKGDYDSAIYHHLSGIEIMESEDSLKRGLINAFYNLSDTYSNFGHMTSALDCIEKSLAIAIELESVNDIPYSHFSLGKAYLEIENYELARQNFYTTLDLLKSQEINDLTLGSLANLGKVYLSENRLDSAKKYFDLYKVGSDQYGDSSSYTKMHVARTIFEYNLKAGQFDKARRNLNEAFYHAKRINLPMELAVELTHYSELFEAMNQSDSALYYYKRAMELTDSVEGAEVQNKIVEIETKYQTAKKEHKISELESEAEVNRARNNLLTVVAISLFALIIIVLVFFSINRRKSQKLAKQNVIIQRSYKEIEDLIRESHHRIKNNLQVVSSLLKMQSKNVHSDEARSSLVEAFNRVKTITLLHQRLQGSKTFKVINLSEFISQLIENITASVTADNSDIDIKTEIDAVEVDTDQSISIGLIINELITNSIKYAFSKGGEVVVALNAKDDNYQLVISDNGRGFPDGFDPQSGKSLGFKIVKSLCIKLKAEMIVKNDGGAKVEIVIPKSPKEQPLDY